MQSTKTLVLAFCVCGATNSSLAQDLLWMNLTDGNSTSRHSMITVGSSASDAEVADDFDVVGSVERVLMSGYGCFSCGGVAVVGVHVRFYESTPANTPGALQAEYFLSAGDPSLLVNATDPTGVDITLPTPFEASGRHFIAVQMEFESWGYWSIWFSSMNNPQGSAILFRDNLAGGDWEPHTDFWGDPTNHDIGFSLWGMPADPEPPVLVDNCGEWVNQDSPNPIDTIDARLNGVEVITPSDIWAVGNYTADVPGLGYDQFSLAMHFDGTDWTIVPSPSPSPAPGITLVDLKAVAAVDSNDVWAAGSKYDVGPGGWVGRHSLALHWNGTQWADAGMPQPGGGSSPFHGASGDKVHDVAAISSDDVWFVGQWFKFLPNDAVVWPGAAIHFDGSDFEVFEMEFAIPNVSQQLNAVSAIASDDVWAVGDGGGSQIYHYDGSSWSRIAGPEPGSAHVLGEVVALAADDVWAGGYYSDAAGAHPLLLHWDGASWTQVASPAGGSVITALAADDMFTMGVNGYAHFDGVEWTAEPAPRFVPWGGLTDLAFVNPCEVVGVGMKTVGDDYATYIVNLVPADAPVPGDLDGDGDVDLQDLAILLADYGCTSGNCVGDIDGDGVTGLQDLAVLMSNYGT